MKEKFKVGDVVVCVNPEEIPGIGPAHSDLKKGHSYVVRNTGWGQDNQYIAVQGLTFECYSERRFIKITI